MATEPMLRTGFDLTCPACGEQRVMLLDLNDLADIRCPACGWNGTAREALGMIRDQADKWERVARWLDLADPDIAFTGR